MPQHKNNVHHSIMIQEESNVIFQYYNAIDTGCLEPTLFVSIPTIPRYYQFDFEYQTMANTLVVHSQ